jgi:hypothetical protein
VEVAEEFKVIEQYAYSLLSLLAFLLGVRPMDTTCSSFDTVQLLLKLISIGTPRLQRVSLRLCRKVLRKTYCNACITLLAYHQPYMLGKWGSTDNLNSLREKRYHWCSID